MNCKKRRASAALAAASVMFLAACSADRVMTPLDTPTPLVSPQIVSAATVVVPGTPAGSFTDFIANNSGRGRTEFWDQISADNTASVLTCNIGFYASGTMQSGCQNESAGSTANQGGYTKYYGDGPGSRDATAFAFAGSFDYVVTLKGSYAGNTSEVGWYTRVGSVITPHPVADWSNKVIGTSVTISTGGATWGFYIKNGSLTTTGGCAGTAYYCSEADGGFSTTPFQQFALFVNAAQTAFLVGAEDNQLEVLPNGFYRDSDYNDYIWSVTPTPSVCDFMTFGRTQIVAANGSDVVISGNAGGNSPQGGILGNFLVKVGGEQYNLQDIAFYGPITSGVFAGADYPNARRIVGTTREGVAVEIRIYDGSEPGRLADAVYVKIGVTEPLGALGVSLDRGNIQYHPQCRGPQG